MALTDFDPLYFTTDEGLYLESQGDFPLLLAKGQRLATGNDGVIVGGTWSLTSATVNFSTRGILAGDVIFLSGARGSATASALEPTPNNGIGGRPFIVDGALFTPITTAALPIREPGGASAQGDPPSGSTLSSVVFQLYTLRPQIKNSSDWARRQLDFDQTADLISGDELFELTIFDALYRRYLSQTRQATQVGLTSGGGGGDVFAIKSGNYKKMRDELLEQLKGRRLSYDAVSSLPIIPIDT